MYLLLSGDVSRAYTTRHENTMKLIRSNTDSYAYLNNAC